MSFVFVKLLAGMSRRRYFSYVFTRSVYYLYRCNWLTPWTRALIQKLIFHYLVKFRACYGTQRSWLWSTSCSCPDPD